MTWKTLPAESPTDSLERQRRAVLQLRASLFEESLGLLANASDEERGAILLQLPEADQVIFKTRTTDLFPAYRSALRDEKSLLSNAINLGHQVQLVSIQRLDPLGNLKGLIRSRAFWLQDGKPLGIEVVRPIGKEFHQLADWRQRLAARVYSLAIGPVPPERQEP
jgi:hypothetical protein